MSKRTKYLLGIGVIAALIIGWQVAAFAVHNTGAFELDAPSANATNAAGTPGDDWDNVCHEVTGTNCGTSADTTGATAVSWKADGNNNATIFTGGGSKDPIDLDQWAWKNAGGLPDKDNLQHSFAARYSLAPNATTCPAPAGATTCELLFFGSDRFDNSGDAQQGFWFFQNPITLGEVKTGGGFNFEGLHENGDLLIISNFSNGGTTSTISIYQWNDQVADNLELLATSNNANCGGPHTNFCGNVNSSTGLTDAPWSFTDKSGNQDFAQGEFFEGGVNLSQLGLADECFASALSETRSSTSTTATLKDFVLADFAPCEAGMATQASNSTESVTPGTSVTDTATVTGSGISPPPDPTGDVTFSLCGPLDTTTTPPEDCTSGGTTVGSPVALAPGTLNDGISTATSDAVNTAADPLDPGKYCFRADWPGDANYIGARSHTNTDTTGDGHECFIVSQPTDIDTIQRWVPQDTATVTPANTAGTVTFHLYSTTDCTGTAVDFVVPDPDAQGVYRTANTTITDDTTVSWKAEFDPDGAEDPSTGVCETANVTFDNDGPDPAP